MIKRLIKRYVKGVSWQHPLLKLSIRVMSPIDFVLRSLTGLVHLPGYKDRVISNGITQQFGGRRFLRMGRVLAHQLNQNTRLTEESKVLEIGCGCGRTALVLSEKAGFSHYTGMDIHKGSIAACLSNRKLTSKGFRFDHLDVQNNEYNPNGSTLAKDFVFPYQPLTFDVIFMVSVFTHMLTDDVKNYISEIARMLQPGGDCMITTFILDKDKEMFRMNFPFKEQDHFYYNEVLPEEAIAYPLSFFTTEFKKYDMVLSKEPVWGSWRGNPGIESTSGFSQDILFFQKKTGTLT